MYIYILCIYIYIYIYIIKNTSREVILLLDEEATDVF